MPTTQPKTKAIKKTVVKATAPVSAVASEAKISHHRHFDGDVVRISGNKTIAVEVSVKVMHPKYRKQYTQSMVYPVHDEKNIAVVGDKVSIEECRPISKRKRWRLVSIVNKG